MSSSATEPPRAWVWVDASAAVRGDHVRFWRYDRDRNHVVTGVDGLELTFADGSTAQFTPRERLQAYRPLAFDMPCTVRVGSDLYPGKVVWFTPAGKKIQVSWGEELMMFHLKPTGEYQHAPRRLILGYVEHYMDPHL